MSTIQDALGQLMHLPGALIYLILGVGAAAENVFPPVPADTFVLAGAVLAARGAADAWLVFLVTWGANVGSATAVYLVARRYGTRFFKMPVARWLLRPHQLERIADFYGGWGVPAIFFSRFLPAWRSMVPVFAGVSRMSAARVIPPLVLASALWYGLLVYAGLVAGRNLEAIVALLSELSRVLLATALLLAGAGAVWWWRTRHGHDRK